MSEPFDRAREEFFSEAQELIDALGRDLLELDDLGTAPDRVNRLFRHVHTLKGLSGLFGATAMSGLSHQLESLLDDARMGRMVLGPEIVVLLYRSVSLYGKILNCAQEGSAEPQADIQTLLAELGSLRSGRVGGDDVLSQYALDPTLLGVLTEYEEHRLRTNLEGGLSLFRVSASFLLMTIEAELESFKSAAQPLGEVITYLPMGDGGDLDSVALEILIASDRTLAELSANLTTNGLTIELVSKRPRQAIPSRLPAMPSNAPPDATQGITPLGVLYLDTPSSRNPLGSSETGAFYTNERAGSSATAYPTDGAPEAPLTSARLASALRFNGESTPPPAHVRAEPLPAIVADAAHEMSLRSVARTVRVDIRKLDNLMNIVGELALVRGALVRLAAHYRASEATKPVAQNLLRLHRDFERELDQLQAGILEVRMVPLGQVFDKVARVVRQTTHEMSKRVNMVITGAETELDKLIVEELSDPLLHLMRNALDHGIESPSAREALDKPPMGTIALNAYQRGNQVVIEIEDDGNGVDLDKVRLRAVKGGYMSEADAADLSEADVLDLLFLPGFTTRDEVTDLSGRGVGLDIVKAHIGKLGGAIEVTTDAQIGTKFSLTLPITLAVIRVLVVECGAESYCIPLAQLDEIVRVDEDKLKPMDARLIYSLREKTLPTVVLGDLYQVQSASMQVASGSRYLAVTQVGPRRLGIVVDAVRGQRDIVIKALGAVVTAQGGFAGATDLGDGRISLVVDVGALLDECLSAEGRTQKREPHALLATAHTGPGLLS